MHRQRRVVFSLTWLSYASLYLCRKGVAVSKARLVGELGLGEAALATIDGAYLGVYALGQFASGLGVQRLGARRMIVLGLIGSAVCCVGFSRSSAPWALVAWFALNGLMQSTGWPAGTSVMAAWYPPRERGAAMGLWSTNYQAGGLAGTALATVLLAHFGWRAAIAGPAVWVVPFAIAIAFALRERPAVPIALEASEARTGTPTGGLGTALRDPAIWVMGLAHFCLKIVLYGLLFWVPYWLHTDRGYGDATAGVMSLALEVGGIAGTIVTGRISDRAVRRGRSFVAAVMMVLLAAALAAQPLLDGAGPAAVVGWIAAVGFFLFGPESLVAGTAAQDLGHRHGTAVAVGAVNGLGSIGAILQGWITLGLRDRFGWSGTFAGFLVLAAIGAVSLFALPLASRRPRG